MKRTPLPFTLAPVIRKGGTCSTSANTFLSSHHACKKNKKKHGHERVLLESCDQSVLGHLISWSREDEPTRI